MTTNVQTSNVRKLSVMAVMTALSVVLVMVLHFPIFPAAPFLEYDPADIPILLVTILYGPMEGFLVTVLASVIQGITVSSGSQIYGIIMHIIATGSYVLVAGSIMKIKKGSWELRALGLAVGAIAMAAVMAGANLLITPFFMNAPVEAVKSMLLPVIIPFNLIKAGVNGLATFMIYAPLSKFLDTRQIRSK